MPSAIKLQYKELKPKVIKYIQRCFGKALAQNKNNPEGVKESLRNISEHIFGNHSNCLTCGNWCKYHFGPNKYKHNSLPNGRSLTNTSLKLKLENLFKVYADNADKLAPYGSTLTNESFNNTVASKAPKNRHYSRSESLVKPYWSSCVTKEYWK
jgi:hypothetical protein